MSDYFQTPSEQSVRSSKIQKFFSGPGLVVLVIFAVIVAWFAIAFFTPDPVHKGNSQEINYTGMAEVLDVGSVHNKCFVQIRRESGWETKQTLPKSDCSKIQKGDVIRLEKGQYASTPQAPIAPVR